ncbi:HTH-type transcriptional activator IlvY [Testudinibacter aquarius]|nr:HTH-type transcriptional activator IlvY [Testudinibacter aquarius]TNG97069.1 HTH-type transcriptional activator IlvY [Pasteurellaceae bacterium USgator41]TNG97230.1 HTH-type transcriptional activator IlvY [Pasteurellaceae bacterium UScroc12]TNG99808.1 HTH-type transcriptional activator IlvY [Pasteurellaceae bacterium UScroc31]TNH01089.1 HTH-type transcriptional activator IlvY [Pasteurellaceae bacterium USgator11]KAE9529846.1 transcriptional regulator IlvY [Testudinibacter aquarius]
MNFQEIKLFLDLVEKRNFNQTALQNHMSPSTLSRQIQKMEAELKQPLFLRDNRQVSLTEAGEQFLQFALPAWQRWQQIKIQLQPVQQELSGELKLFCSVTAAYSHLPPILEAFRRQYPKVEIKLTTGDPANALEQVRSQQADLALVGKPLKLPDNIDFHFIDYIQLSLIAPRVACPSTRLLQQQPIDWEQIPFILPVAGPVRERIDLWFKQMKFKQPKIYASVSGHEGIVPMVALGCGVALLPDIVIKNSPMNGQVSYLDLPLSASAFELGVCVQKKRLQQPLIAAFWSVLTDASPSLK